jgi:NDP-sugar pyrophosphorylase family protein
MGGDDRRHAVILAGGKGTRLRPFTTTLPKPLVPIGGESSILEIVLRQLSHHGFESATLAIGHMGEIIHAYVGDGSRWGLQVDYTTEEAPLGTMGPVVAVLERLPEHFLVMNGDILTDLHFGVLLDAESASNAPITVATYRRDVPVDFGVLEVEGDQIVSFTEKPTLEYRVSMGVYALARTTLGRYTPGEALGFDGLMLDLLARGESPASYPFDGYWLDIGRPEDYERANADWPEVRQVLLPPG